MADNSSPSQGDSVNPPAAEQPPANTTVTVAVPAAVAALKAEAGSGEADKERQGSLPSLAPSAARPNKPSVSAGKPAKGAGAAIDEHLMTLEQVCERYSVQVNAQKPMTSQGLSSQTAKERSVQYGLNIMTPPKQVPLFVKYLQCLSNLFNLLLIGSGILSFIVFAIDPPNSQANITIGAVLIGVAVLNALIDFTQEQKSAQLMKSFMDMVPRKCMVVRDGQLKSGEAMSLVPGDVVQVRMGDKMPADIRVFQATDFKVDNSSLTGEADPQERNGHNTHENPLEATNLAFNGSLVVNGEAYGIVIRTGDQTVLGQIAGMAGNEKKRVSPMTKEVNDFVHRVTAVAILVAVIFFCVGWSKNPSLAFNVNFAIGVFVSFVPEGLPTTMTILLTIAAQRMAKRNVLVKELRGVETLGAITCLATDKTGTLTRNQMTVTNVWSALQMWDATKPESEEKGKGGNVNTDYGRPGEAFGMKMMTPAVATLPKFNMDLPMLNDLLHICYLCSKARFDRTDVPLKQRNIIGDATESGLFRFASETIPDSDGLRAKFPTVFEIPFNSTNKWHLSVHKKQHANGSLTLFIKGAPERIIRLCTSILLENGKVEPLSDAHQRQFLKAYEAMASQGHRVIGSAQLKLNGTDFPENFIFQKDEEDRKADIASAGSTKHGVYPKTGYTFTGLVSLEDPPKHGVREAIGKCRQAGIKVMMVTGDHPLTAEAIGRKINLMVQETRDMIAKRTGRPLASIKEDEYNAIVIHGEMIDKFTDEDWEHVLDKEEIIFARTSPKHKLQIVKRCQARGHIVGVTGDGVNDSPALKTADLGISMNISGSDVSKEAAAMILLDDNFASTVAGIQEGRLIFQNLKKSVKYTLTHTIPEVSANLIYLILEIPAPLNPLMIIVIDLGFEIFAALSFAWEVPESRKMGLMAQIPRKPVTPKSMDLLRRENEQAAEKKKEIHRFVYGPEHAYEDAADEEQELEGKSLGLRFRFAMAHVRYFFVHLFDRKQWALTFAPREEDVLISNGVQSWAYLEAGVIQTLGCFLTYYLVFANLFNDPYLQRFTPAEVSDLGQKPPRELTALERNTWQSAASAYFLAIIFQQAFNLFICKVTLRFPFGKMVFRNRSTFVGLGMGILLAMFFVYPPFMWPTAFATYYVNPGYWLFPMAFGVVLLAYATARIAIVRRRQPTNLNMALPLDLHPTRWSTASH